MSRNPRHQLTQRLKHQRVARAAKVHQPTARKVALAEMKDALIESQITLFGMADGDDSDKAVKLLSHLAWLLAIGVQLAQRKDLCSVESRRLHGALRQVVDLCLQGYRWRTQFAPMFETAAADCHRLMLEDEALALRFQPDADYICARIKMRAVAATDVAGAEIYAQPREVATC